MALTNVFLHGDLGSKFRAEWKLSVSSVAEALQALFVNTNHKLEKYLLEKDKEGIKYKILVNEKPIEFEQTEQLVESISNSEFMARWKNLDRIDIVPVIEGAGEDVLTLIAGVLLIAIGAVLIAFSGGALTPLGIGLIIAGVGLLAAGIISMLSSPPQINYDAPNNKNSYLLNGPVNVIQEGGPVPVGYGRLLVGSQVIGASYDITFEEVPWA